MPGPNNRTQGVPSSIPNIQSPMQTMPQMQSGVGGDASPMAGPMPPPSGLTANMPSVSNAPTFPTSAPQVFPGRDGMMQPQQTMQQGFTPPQMQQSLQTTSQGSGGPMLPPAMPFMQPQQYLQSTFGAPSSPAPQQQQQQPPFDLTSWWNNSGY